MVSEDFIDGATATNVGAYRNCADHLTEINDSGVYIPVTRPLMI